MDPFAIITSLFGPFLLWPLEYLFPYPYILEEVAKAFIILGTAERSKSEYKTYFVCGILFALTETVLYSININLFGRLSLLFVRLATSSALHSLTFLIIYWFYRRKMIIPGILLAGLIHFLYNFFIR